MKNMNRWKKTTVWHNLRTNEYYLNRGKKRKRVIIQEYA